MPARAQPDPNRPRYTLTVNVDLPSNSVSGDLKVRFTPDAPTDKLVFRLWPNGPALAGVGSHLDVGNITVGGTAAPSSFSNPTTLVLPGTHPAGQPVDAAMTWRLTLPGAVNDRVARIGDAVRLGSFFPILPWESGVGWDDEPPPPQFAEASTAPTADFDVTVTTNPADLGVLASGTQDRPGHWSATAVRDFAMSTGRFTVATATARAPDPVSVTVGASAGTGVDPAQFAAKAVNVLQTHSARFGPYAWSTYTLAITPSLSGGIEYPTFVMQGPSTIGRTTSHELGHQWFYSLVGNNQGRDPWLDEGLATYAEGRYEGTIDGFKTASIGAGAAGHLGEPMTYWGNNHAFYNQGVYIQGAKALANLGDLNLVDCALRIYAARNAYRIARPADLINSLAAVFPNAAQVMASFGAHP
ncbi:MAG: hypothetical protein JOZ68_13965 [Acidimicrobiia bacterium]|nr:hypothetical protein [Acidimicrobiia bacterium]